MINKKTFKEPKIDYKIGEKYLFIFHAVNTFFSTLGPLIAVFVILKVETIGVWGALAVGQAIGLLSSVFVSLGTGVSGASEISNSEKSTQSSAFLEISVIQIITFIPASVASFFTAILFSSSNHFVAGLGSISINSSALTVAWFFYGTGEPKKLLLAETLPRFLITLISLLIFIQTKDIYIQLLIQIIFNLCLYTFTFLFIFKHTATSSGFHNFRKKLGSQYRIRLKSSSIALVSCLSFISPILILSVTANAVVPVWAVAEKVTRYFEILNEPLTNRYKNLSRREEIKSMKSFFSSRVFVLHIASGFLISIAMFLTGPILIGVLSSNKISLSSLSLLLISISLFIRVSIKQPAFLFLASRDNLTGILHSLGIAFLITIPTLYVMTSKFTFTGICLGVLMSQLLLSSSLLYKVNSSIKSKQ